MISFLFVLSLSYDAKIGHNNISITSLDEITVNIPDNIITIPDPLNISLFDTFIVFHNPTLFTYNGTTLEAVYKNVKQFKINPTGNYAKRLDFSVVSVQKTYCDYVDFIINKHGVVVSTATLENNRSCQVYVASEPTNYNITALRYDSTSDSIEYHEDYVSSFNGVKITADTSLTRQCLILCRKDKSTSRTDYSVAIQKLSSTKLSYFHIWDVFSVTTLGYPSKISGSVEFNTYFENVPISEGKLAAGRSTIYIPGLSTSTVSVATNTFAVLLPETKDYEIEYGKLDKDKQKKDDDDKRKKCLRFNTEGYIKITNKKSEPILFRVAVFQLPERSYCRTDKTVTMIGPGEAVVTPKNSIGTLLSDYSFTDEVCVFVASASQMVKNSYSWNNVRAEHHISNEKGNLTKYPFYIKASAEIDFGTLTAGVITTTKTVYEEEHLIVTPKSNYLYTDNIGYNGNPKNIIMIIVFVIIFVIFIGVCGFCIYWCCFCKKRHANSSSSSSGLAGHGNPNYPAGQDLHGAAYRGNLLQTYPQGYPPYQGYPPQQQPGFPGQPQQNPNYPAQQQPQPGYPPQQQQQQGYPQSNQQNIGQDYFIPAQNQNQQPVRSPYADENNAEL